MPDRILLPWTPLAASRRASRAVVVAGLLVFLTLSALLVAAVLRPDALRLSVFALAVLVTGCAGLYRVKAAPSPVFEVSLAGGEILVRPGAEPERVTRAFPVYVSTIMLVLRDAQGQIVVWHDALAAGDFRRLLACCRWHLDRTRQLSKNAALTESGAS